MISLKQSIKEFLDSWVECSKCKYMFDVKSIRACVIITSSEGTKHFCDECSDSV